MEAVAEGLWGLADHHEKKGEIGKVVKCLEAICQSQVSFLPIVEVKTRIRIATLLLKHSHNVNHAKSHLERCQLLLKSIPSCFELKCRAYSLLSQCYHLVGAIPSQKQILNKGLELTASSGEGFSAKLWFCNFNSQLANALTIEGDYQGSISALESGYNCASEIFYPELQTFVWLRRALPTFTRCLPDLGDLCATPIGCFFAHCGHVALLYVSLFGDRASSFVVGLGLIAMDDKKQYKFLINKPPDRKEVGEAKYEDWSAEDAQIHILLWNNMEPKISGSLFCSVCEELDLAEPVSADISILQKQRESMRVACFLFGFPSNFDSVHAQLLTSKELPSLIVVLAESSTGPSSFGCSGGNGGRASGSSSWRCCGRAPSYSAFGYSSGGGCGP
ncbi:tetratricopeptide repeat (TPR)-like superfamily protein [Actinidia rufa]|uniref:Tetratricopeptide repeat (TPR)-like superfamily protein n=1 Tax=Actinidia rufa TaxID=165716 RepID=A0A7J0FM79_9ERIC|nr:tetratricopeptide repeat (TPR)-like superfamily protein [Actinidia rufa]